MESFSCDIHAILNELDQSERQADELIAVCFPRELLIHFYFKWNCKEFDQIWNILFSVNMKYNIVKTKVVFLNHLWRLFLTI